MGAIPSSPYSRASTSISAIRVIMVSKKIWKDYDNEGNLLELVELFIRADTATLKAANQASKLHNPGGQLSRVILITIIIHANNLTNTRLLPQ
jgi:hypothetical protein